MKGIELDDIAAEVIAIRPLLVTIVNDEFESF
jgi:hypothetical protein